MVRGIRRGSRFEGFEVDLRQGDRVAQNPSEFHTGV